MAEPLPDAEPLVRSIFYYNQAPSLGDTVGLHFFEPRYRLLTLRALRSPSRRRQFVFLPNFVNYQAAHGDVGFLTTIVEHRAVPGASATELPRADVRIRFDACVLILFQWLEDQTGGLSECLCVPVRCAGGVPATLSSPEHWPFARQEALLQRLKECAAAGEGRCLPAGRSQGHDDLSRYVLHVPCASQAQASLEALEVDVPGAGLLVEPVVVNASSSATVALTRFMEELATLYMELSGAATTADGSPREASVGGSSGSSLVSRSASSDPASSDADLLHALPVRELRNRLAKLHVSSAALGAALEKTDLVELLSVATESDRLQFFMAQTADFLATEMDGMRVPIACGCPTAGMVIRSCRFARMLDDPTRLSQQRAGQATSRGPCAKLASSS